MGKRVLLYYFSGTGNTFLAASFLKKHFEERGDVCDLCSFVYPPVGVLQPQGYDLIGFGYPIHAFNVPLAFLNFVKDHVGKGNQPYFIFKTSGEPFHLNDASSHKLYRLLKKKGYRFVMEKHFLMPYNIMFRYPDALAKQMDLYLDALCNLLTLRLEKGESDKPHYPWPKQLLSVLLRIEWIAPGVNAWFTYVKKKKCLACDKCIRDCPNKALYRNKKGKIKINSRCSMCMRCTMNCPVDAFHFGFLNNWKVVGRYDFKTILADEKIPSYYVYPEVKGYFRHFRKYFAEQDALLARYGLPIPVKYPPKEK
jgi:ferredoxin/flavodoxin